MTANKKDSPASYHDCAQIMDLALKKPGLRLEFNSPGKAINFKQRCNRYRNMLRQQSQELYDNVPGQRASCVYDILVIRMRDAKNEPTRSGKILIFDHESVDCKIIDPETNKEITFEPQSLFDEGDIK